jgi:DNA polymerase-3 subunit gamma/tau
MRFDLRRVPPETMIAHLEEILGREGIGFEPEALAMIVRAGEGSVRDNQSLLDQAISHGDGTVTAETVRAMLGLGDRARTIDLFEHLMRGDIAGALTLMRELYDAGADPQTLIADLCDFTHLVTRIKIVPAAADDVSLTPDERTRGAELAGKLAMRALTRTWQILFKGYDEVAEAGNALQAAEMVLVRLAYAADLPTPDELATRFAGSSAVPAAPVATAPVPRGNGGGGGMPAAQALRVERPAPARFESPAPAPAPTPGTTALASPQTYAELVELAGAKRDLIVQHALKSSLRPIAFADGRIEVALVEGADPGIIQTLSARLKLWTGRSWMIGVGTSSAELVPTMRELETQKTEADKAAAHEDPLVRAILETFPGSRVSNVTVREEAAPMPELPPLSAYDEEDDDE